MRLQERCRSCVFRFRTTIVMPSSRLRRTDHRGIFFYVTKMRFLSRTSFPRVYVLPHCGEESLSSIKLCYFLYFLCLCTTHSLSSLSLSFPLCIFPFSSLCISLFLCLLSLCVGLFIFPYVCLSDSVCLGYCSCLLFPLSFSLPLLHSLCPRPCARGDAL